MYKFTEEERELLRREEGFSEELIDSLQYIDEDESYLFSPDSGDLLLGDILISTDKVVEQAKEYGHSVRREVGYLTIHSMLHLLGYDHLDEGEQKMQMRKREEEIAASIPGMQR